MTSSTTTTTIKAVRDGTNANPKKRENGIHVLREREAKCLIEIVTDAARETADVAHDIFGFLYERDKPKVSDAEIQQHIGEALACLRVTEHYLLMLGSVFDERELDKQAPWPADPAL